MNPLAGLVFLCGVAALILLSGYWLNALELVESGAERLALGAVAGLATLLLLVDVVNFFLPLSGPGLLPCLLPAAGVLLWPRPRRQLLADFRTSVLSRSGLMVLGLAALFLALLLGPALLDWQLLFYDGTPNHDSYIWITAGEHLQHHTYLDPPTPSKAHPWMNMAEDNMGWNPRRGQLGTETLLALFSSLAATTPLHTCLYFAGALFLPWCAAVYLVVTTFFRSRISRPAIAGLVFLQPIFVFFHANSNLPNLFGAITGAAVVIATEQALRAGTTRHRLGWCALVLLGFHGLLAAYPEMAPFTLLPAGLLWLRPWLARRWQVVRANGSLVAAAFAAGAAIDPAITIRAWRGFTYSFRTARTDDIFSNLFEPLNAAQYVPGFATLSIPAAEHLGWVLGAVLTIMLVAAALAGWARARDRIGVLCMLTGSALLVVYTLLTGFKYGWQKSVQFGGIFVAASLTAPLLEALFEEWRRTDWRRRAAGACLAGIVAFFVAGTLVNFGEIHLWRQQKGLSRDWFALRRLSDSTLREQPVLVEAASFRMPFFHTMWSAYFLSSSRIYFARRGGEGGGYLRLGVHDESFIPGGRPAALLVGRRWSECFDANSPRLLEGREYVLLRDANRVTKLEGVYPTNGYPDHASRHFSIEVTPHSPSRLRLTIAPYKAKLWPQATWRITHRSAAGESSHELAGPPPWQIDVALAPGRSQTVECEVVGAADTSQPWPFAVRQVTIESIP
ncbi:MAG TPA: hypothetical protein VG734_10720 [Lacunisphaera sp.]|nr:hypothetical protein [Lacunisphaera sp.]